ncbi:uncharacterized protein BX663DRAFT_546066 [Cokeromyces recurvatus]|uniref:uncharacterized protein n=1 Tax=Cokeromyces recurvatus TaxID=90255 RepID=UPI00221F4AD1|nr:uncharacterized protein BX663DRAFT_546066 [Cokeromyces recurvatus]KAI7898868.1 hypothetical protein BX663DRAFT_546066 [Cokeromyces recurvatus]
MNNYSTMLHHTLFMTPKDEKQEIIEITQNLAPEQFQYEFPPRSLTIQVNEIKEKDFSFFDEFSFTSNSTEDLLDHYLDSISSAPSTTIEDRIDWDNSSFVFPDYTTEKVCPSLHPYQHDDDTALSSRMVVMKISRHMQPTIVMATEEDNDGPLLELPLESTSVFLSTNEQPTTTTTTFNHRIHNLERQLEHEKAMRIAFEKTMEEMTVLMDHQHQVLNQRLQQEVDIRQSYEKKMEHLMDQLNRESEAVTYLVDQLKEEAEQRKVLQVQLKDTIQEIATLKKRTNTNSQQRIRSVTKNAAVKRIPPTSTVVKSTSPI